MRSVRLLGCRRSLADSTNSRRLLQFCFHEVVGHEPLTLEKFLPSGQISRIQAAWCLEDGFAYFAASESQVEGSSRGQGLKQWEDHTRHSSTAHPWHLVCGHPAALAAARAPAASPGGGLRKLLHLYGYRANGKWMGDALQYNYLYGFGGLLNIIIV